MIIFWAIRYIDRTDRQWKDRRLFLDTTKLPTAQRAAIELAIETKVQWDFLRFRPLFVEEKTKEGFSKWFGHGHRSFHLHGYHEDETGAEVSLWDLGYVPPGMEAHDIEHRLSPSTPVPIAEITLQSNEIKNLAYFKRELRELTTTAFWKDGPGSLNCTGNVSSPGFHDPELKTAVSDEEIRSFVTIFRRLYMEGEQANFVNSNQCLQAVSARAPAGQVGSWRGQVTLQEA